VIAERVLISVVTIWGGGSSVTRPLLEIADLIRTAGAASSSETTSGFVRGMSKCCPAPYARSSSPKEFQVHTTTETM
jgi:hypothetical protein